MDFLIYNFSMLLNFVVLFAVYAITFSLFIIKIIFSATNNDLCFLTSLEERIVRDQGLFQFFTITI